MRTEALADRSSLLDDPDSLRASAEADGALLLRALLDAELVDRVRAVALDAGRAAGWLHPDHPPSAGIARPGLAIGAYDDGWLEVQRTVVGDPSWDALGAAPALQPALEAVLGTPPVGGHGSVLRAFSTAGGQHTTPPHQERAFIGGTFARLAALSGTRRVMTEDTGPRLVDAARGRVMLVNRVYDACGKNAGRPMARLRRSRIR